MCEKEPLRNYLLLKAKGPDALNRLVQEKLDKGWQLWGSPVVAIATAMSSPQSVSYFRYCQAVVWYGD